MLNGMKRLMAGAALAPLGLFGWAGPVAAETLRDALARAYVSNPILAAARSQQKAVDEQVAIAKAGERPSAEAVTTYTEFALHNQNTTFRPDRRLTLGVELAVPLYQGGAVSSSIKAARTRVVAGLSDLRDAEATMFSQAVAAYMDVIRDEAIFELNKANVRVLETNLQATRDRFQVGDLTRTDVAQSEARLADARSRLESGAAQLVTSRENYIKVIGVPAVALEAPPPLPPLPATPQEAVAVAVANNPGLKAAEAQSKAAGYDTRVAKAGVLPKVSAIGSANYVDYLGTERVIDIRTKRPRDSTRDATVGIRASIPLYQGGRPGAQVRQAQAREAVAMDQVIGAERNVVAQTRSAYAAWRASKDVIVSSETAVEANRLSLEGVRAENSVGTRTILDVLNAEQELLNAQVQLVSAQRNAYVAGFTLLANMGRAEARDLGLDGGALYDPGDYGGKMGWRILDFDYGSQPQAGGTRTVDTPAQTSDVEQAVQP